MEYQRILRTPAAAGYLGLSESTLEKMRLRGDGPVFVKLGKRAIGYEISALDAWIAGGRRSSTSEAA